MSRDKNPPTPNDTDSSEVPTVREAARKLLAELDVKTSGWNPADRWDDSMVAAISTLRWALDAELAPTPPIWDPKLAQDGIGLIERHAPPGELTADHVTAVVDAAKAAFVLARSFDIRLDADRRAIARWQADAPGRELVYPDHADLLVWLLELIETRPACPSPDEVDEMIRRLRAVYVASPMINDACGMMEKLANALIASSRRTVMAEARANGQPIMISPLDHAGRPPATFSIVRGHDLASACEESIVGDAGRGSMEQSHSGDGGKEHWLVEKALADGLIADGVIWQEPGEGGRLMAEYLAELSGLPIRTRTGPRFHDSLRTVLGRPDVQEAIAKALAVERGADWEAATEAGRNAFRGEAAKLLSEASSAPRG